MKSVREINPFEDEQVAREWISHIEDDSEVTRKVHIYPRLRRWARSFRWKIIVEVGSGQGICSREIEVGQGKYFGVEPSLPLVKRARQLYRRSNVKFLKGNAYRLPFPAKKVDAIFSVFVWFHLKNLTQSSRELCRVLKPGGRFYIITANPGAYDIWESFYSPYRKRANMIDGRANVSVNPLSRNIIYLHTLGEMISALEKNRLGIASVEIFGNTHGDRSRGIAVGIEGYRI